MTSCTRVLRKTLNNKFSADDLNLVIGGLDRADNKRKSTAELILCLFISVLRRGLRVLEIPEPHVEISDWNFFYSKSMLDGINRGVSRVSLTLFIFSQAVTLSCSL